MIKDAVSEDEDFHFIKLRPGQKVYFAVAMLSTKGVLGIYYSDPITTFTGKSLLVLLIIEHSRYNHLQPRFLYIMHRPLHGS